MRTNVVRFLGLLCVVSFFQFAGCGVSIPLSSGQGKLAHLKLHMTQQVVMNAIGEPDEVRGALKNTDGDIVTVWQYDLYKESSAWLDLALGPFTGTLTWWAALIGKNSYWLYFVGDELAQWGRAGDWQPDAIMQIRIRHE